MRRIIYALGGVAVLAGVALLMVLAANGGPASGDAPDVEAIIGSYSGWTALTDAPRPVSMLIYILCRLPTEEEMAFTESEHGNRYLLEYVNEIGREAMLSPDTTEFPVGTVIVKEKLGALESDAAEALGIMIKREAGYNPSGGDWEYIYWEHPDSLMRDKPGLMHCQQCHYEQAETDSVFRPYVAY